MHKTAKYYCFDCDGVLWRGSEVIPEAREYLINLNQKSENVLRFITNSSICTRDQHANKINTRLDLPFKIKPEQVITAAYVTANYLSERLKMAKGVLVLGMEGIKLELVAAGLLVTEAFDSNVDYGTVVVGFDVNFSYSSMSDAIRVFQKFPDAILVGCNLDATYVDESGQIFPGTGSLVTAVAYATCRNPIIMGKPNNFIYDALLDSCPEFKPQEAVFIGDRLDSDIAFANKNGIFSILVETGVHRRSDVTNDQKPSLCISSLTELL